MDARTARAVERLRHGGIAFYPTDTLYGLGVDATNREAVEALIRLKDRPGAQPISIAVSSNEEIEPLAELSDEARQFVRTHLPGPYTVLVRPSARARQTLAPSIAEASPTLGIRVPDHPLARELARALGPITATSANRHGDPPARSTAVARRLFGAGISAYLDGAPHPSGAPSTLVDLSGPRPRLHPRA